MSDNERPEPEEGCKPSEPKEGCEPSESKGCCDPADPKEGCEPADPKEGCEPAESKEGCEPAESKEDCEPAESKGCCKELPSGGYAKFCRWPALRPLKLVTRKGHPFQACKRRLWKTTEDWCVVLCGTQTSVSSCKRRSLDGKIVIPKGTVVDGASVPLPWLVSFLSFGILRPNGILLIPSIVHDYAYKHGCLPYRIKAGKVVRLPICRDHADWLFREMIRGINHTKFWACIAWLAVRLGWWFCVKYNSRCKGGKAPVVELVCFLLALAVLFVALAVLVVALCSASSPWGAIAAGVLALPVLGNAYASAVSRR